MVDLVVVESPGKAAAVARYLAQALARTGDEAAPVVEGAACCGHIRDLPARSLAVAREDGTYALRFVTLPDKRDTVARLREAARRASRVWLAADADREGEAIAWHLREALGLKSSKSTAMRRLRARAITAAGVQEAAREATDALDERLVAAQHARRALDRLLGYRATPALWRATGVRGASVGRVQSAVLLLLAERWREAAAATATATATESTADEPPPPSPPLTGDVVARVRLLLGRGDAAAAVTVDARVQWRRTTTTTSTTKSAADDTHQDAPTLAEAVAAFQTRVAPALSACPRGTVRATRVSDSVRRPPPAYTTAAFQQDAAARLGLDPAAAMRAAQALYEAGHITYMRTDSTRVAPEAAAAARAHISRVYGDAYVGEVDGADGADGGGVSHTRRRPQQQPPPTTTTPAQDAHEAIRPTDFEDGHAAATTTGGLAGLAAGAAAVYALIRTRALASLMAPARLRTTAWTLVGGSDVDGDVDRDAKGWEAEARRTAVVFPGFLAAMTSTAADAGGDGGDADGADDDADDNVNNSNDKWTAELAPGDAVEVVSAAVTPRVRRAPPAPYDLRGAVRCMEAHGVGRPSTYAPTLDKLVAHGYVGVRDVPPRIVRTAGAEWLGGGDGTRGGGAVRETKHELRVGGATRALVPTQAGLAVAACLASHFADACGPGATAAMEARLDAIARGEASYVEVVAAYDAALSGLLSAVPRAVGSGDGGGDPFARRLSLSLPGGDAADAQAVVRRAKYGPVIEVAAAGGGVRRFIGLQPFLAARSLGGDPAALSDADAAFLVALPAACDGAAAADRAVRLCYGRFGLYYRREDDGATARVPPSRVRATPDLRALLRLDAPPRWRSTTAAVAPPAQALLDEAPHRTRTRTSAASSSKRGTTRGAAPPPPAPQ